jgi:hypothetical protein
MNTDVSSLLTARKSHMLLCDVGLAALLLIFVLLLILGKKMVREQMWCEITVLGLVLAAGIFLGIWNAHMPPLREVGDLEEFSTQATTPAVFMNHSYPGTELPNDPPGMNSAQIVMSL